MVPDWALEIGIIASVLSLASLQPIVYRFIVGWLWPYSIRFELPPGHEDQAQAGLSTRLLVVIRNRTPDPAFFQIGAWWPTLPGSGHLPVELRTYRDYPKTEEFGGQLKLGPFERQHVYIAMTPVRRGDFQFETQISEFFHGERYPNWLAFRRKVLRLKKPRLRPLIFSMPIHLSVRTWAVAREELPKYIGRGLTDEERALDDAFEKNQRQQE